ncbi:MAG: hypothetical protein E5Y51_09640 [Mesorhizobium sp.]|nr:MAG: hypothetical protein E5Y51_09640 [Mesorhizobium sp.]
MMVCRETAGRPPSPALNDAGLKAFLHKRQPRPPVFSVDGLDDYLTVHIIGPRFVDMDPSVYR